MINMISSRSADNYRLARSGKITLGEDATYAVIKVPKKAFILGVYLEIITPFTDTATDGTISVGFSGNNEVADVDYFLTTAEANAIVAGMKSSVDGKWFADGSGSITVTAVGNTSTNDPVVRVFVAYTVIN